MSDEKPDKDPLDYWKASTEPQKPLSAEQIIDSIRHDERRARHEREVVIPVPVWLYNLVHDMEETDE